MSKLDLEARMEILISPVPIISLCFGDFFLFIPLKLTLGLNGAEMAVDLGVGCGLGWRNGADTDSDGAKDGSLLEVNIDKVLADSKLAVFIELKYKDGAWFADTREFFEHIVVLALPVIL